MITIYYDYSMFVISTKCWYLYVQRSIAGVEAIYTHSVTSPTMLVLYLQQNNFKSCLRFFTVDQCMVKKLKERWSCISTHDSEEAAFESGEGVTAVVCSNGR